MEKEERASVVELRRFTDLLSKLPYVVDDDISCGALECYSLFVPSFQDEKTSIVEMAQSGNAIVDKCILTFSSLLLETNLLIDIAHNRIYPAFLLYGEDVDGCLETEGGSVKMMASFLPFLQESSVYVNRCYEVVRNILFQIHSFYLLRDDVLGNARDRKLLRIWHALGSLLSVLIMLDEVIQKHPVLLQHWEQSVQSTRHNPARFDAESPLLKPFLNVILQIDLQIMRGFVFKNCCQQMFPEGLHRDVQFSARMRGTILELYEKWERIAIDDIADKRRLSVIISLTLLYFCLFQNVDKKLIKTVWNSYKHLAVFHVFGNIVWTPCEFLLKNIPDIEKFIDRKSVNVIRNVRSMLIDQQAGALTQEVALNLTLFNEWQCKMDEELQEWPRENVHSHIIYRTSLFLKFISVCFMSDEDVQGMRQADLLSRTVRLVLCGSLVEKKPLSRSTAIACLRLIEIMKAIQKVFLKLWMKILESVQQGLQHWSGHLLRLVNSVKEFLRSETNISNDKVDIISALSVAELALSGSVFRESLAVVGIALDFACYMLFFSAISDVKSTLDYCRHASVANMYKKFRDEIFDDFEKRFLLKLCEFVETDLRLSMHSYLQPVEERLAKGPVKDQSFHLKNLLQLAPLALCGQFVDVKRYAELHLERAFYNLTAVALHDCHTYIEMRLIAREKYGLQLCESRLPFQTLDQGLDVLLVTRNLHSFVSNYNYNLNEQFFVEKDSKNKHLNILTVEHIANSMRTHGTGIMNTVINFAYQYLKRKFYVFSQFLYDDHIKGQLIKEIRNFQGKADQLNKMYPVKRAQHFNSAIRRLGMSEDGLSFLDKFRVLITQIGNVMGYVRLVRSGSVQASSHSLAFLPDSDEFLSFSTLAVESNFSKETVDAGKTLDLIFEETAKNVNQTNNYLQILVQVFSKELRNFEKYEHLSNFYIIVPSLTVNYTENILTCKGKLGRRAQQNNTFTDDGFILGIAFILTTLNQVEQFESLNWFASVEKRCEEEFESAKVTKTSASQVPMEPSVTLRVAKLEHYQKILLQPSWITRLLMESWNNFALETVLIFPSKSI